MALLLSWYNVVVMAFRGVEILEVYALARTDYADE